MPDLYAVGSFGEPDQWSPVYLIQTHDAWPLLEGLAVRPGLSAPDLAEAVGRRPEAVDAALADFTRVGAVRQQYRLYRLAFAWYSPVAQDSIHAAVRQAAADLAGRIRERSAAIDAHLQKLKASRWADIRDLRFALVGCFGLDWGGLEALKAGHWLVHEKEQPGDRRYVMYVEEPVDRYRQKDYCGSHTADIDGGFRFTSFGDHSGRRFGLPDVVWQLAGAVARSERLPADRRDLLTNAVLEAVDSVLPDAARALVAAANGQAPPRGPARVLLEGAGGLQGDIPGVPVFLRTFDSPAMDAVVNIVKVATLSVVADWYPRLEAALGGLQAGIPFGEHFNYIWHVMFAQTNRLLAEDGYLADPAPSDPAEGRYRWWLTVAEG